jgi:NADH-quinone oxidoreductase subunit N
MMELSYFLPEIIVFVGACVILLLSVFPIPNKKTVLGALVFLVPLLALLALFKDIPYLTNSFPAGSMVIQDSVADFCRALLLLISFPVLLSSIGMFTKESKRHGEFLFLMLISLGSLMIMVQATNLIMLFLAIEGASIPLYMIAGLKAGNEMSKEAVIKYFILGAFASALTIYGISLIFSVAKSFDFAIINKVTIDSLINTMSIGTILVFAGLAFKVAVFPFHFWAPDVYEGAPPISAAFISVAPKIGAMIVMARFVAFGIPAGLMEMTSYLLMGMSVASMTYGNITALVQTEVKRIMAYSSIAQIGYMLIAIVALTVSTSESITSGAISGLMMYLAAYALMNIAAFSIIKVVKIERGGSSIDHFKGLAKTHPVLALCMLITLVSLLGIPFTAGFFGKLYVFSSAIGGSVIWIVVVAIINSAISAFYYFNIAKAMYIEQPDDENIPVTLDYLKNPATISSIACTLGTLAIGVIPVVIEAMNYASIGFGK